jgi:hypothetical protein
MNDQIILTLVGLILAIALSAFVVYIRYRRKHPRAGGSASNAPASAPQSSTANPAASEIIQNTAPPNPNLQLNPDLERRWLAVAMAATGFLFEFFSIYLQKDLPDKNSWAYIPFLMIGLLLFAGGFLTASRLDHRTFFEPALYWISLKLGVRPSQCVCLLSGIVMAGIATVAAGTNPLMISPVIAILSWVAGISLTVLGGWHLDPSTERTRLPLSAWAWAVLLTLAAFLLRAIRIGQIPLVLAGDEGSSGFDALLLLNGKANNPFGVFGWTPSPFLYFYIESVGVAALGRTIEAVRLSSALAGALTVGGLYFLGRSMYGHRYGLAAALLLSALHLNMEFSRQALNIIWDGLWYLITLGALWYGWKSGRRAFWILAGLAFGIGQYFYFTDRTLIATVPLFLVAATVIDRSGWRRNLGNVLPSLASLAAVVLPLAWNIHIHPDQYLGHASSVSIIGDWMTNAVRETGLPVWRILLKQFSLGFGAFFSVNLSWWYRPGVPILRTLPAVFFISGLAILALRLRDTRTWILLLWLLAFGVTVSLSESTPASQRLPGVTPACALVVGFGVVEIFSLMEKLLPAFKRLFPIAAILLAGYMAVDELRFYFFDFAPQNIFEGRYDNVGVGGEVSMDIVRTLKNEPGSWQVLFFRDDLMGYFSDPALPFLLPNATGIDVSNPWGSPDNPAVSGQNLLFVFMPERKDDIPLVQADYPGGVFHEVDAPDGSVLYSYYLVRSGG